MSIPQPALSSQPRPPPPPFNRPPRQDVYANFRGKDMSLKQARREAVVAGARSAWEADRDAAVRATANAV